MMTITWKTHLFVSLILVLLLAACGRAAPEVPVSETLPETGNGGQETAVDTGETQNQENPAPSTANEETTTLDTETASSVIITLLSRHARTEYSAGPEDLTEPPATIEPPPEDSWRELQPDESTDFKSYDGVRVREEGEAWLDLGDLMHLILKRDSVAQFVPGEDARGRLAGVDVLIPEATPLLQRLVLGIHLSRGGLIGDKLEQSDAIALTTPNAVIIVSGTEFFLAYDPDTNTTVAGNFNGTIDVAATELQEGDALPQRELITIPPVRGQKFWPIHDHLDFQEFARLIDLMESPIAATDMISGPYLVIENSAGADVHSGPGQNFSTVGTMDEGDYARILLEGDGWWQIACPENINASECWLASGDTADYNAEVEKVTSTYTATPADTATPTDTPTPTNTPTNTPIPVAICRVSASSVGLWQGPGGQRSDGGLIYNSIGYESEGAELEIIAGAYSNQWYYVKSLDSGNVGWVYAPNCPLINDGPIPPASDIPATVTYTPSPTPTPTPTNTPTPTPTFTPTPTGTPATVTANFSLSKEGLTVTFSNLSTNADSYFWDFGDGSTSTEVNPVHVYSPASEGSYAYTVTLTAYGPGGSDTEVKIDVVTGVYIG
jgi:hypothetical protein